LWQIKSRQSQGIYVFTPCIDRLLYSTK
jgi:hypothetical protein